jgi:hypothetical protein
MVILEFTAERILREFFGALCIAPLITVVGVFLIYALYSKNN